MESDVDCVRLVKLAQGGDKECLEQLTKLAQQSLQEDVYRMTLERDLAQDIVQETVLEMLKILGELEEADRFWPWLYKIALNKIRLHRRAEKRRSAVPISAAWDLEDQKNGQEAMSEVAARELKQIIFKAMWQLKPQHREVLTMRCYKEMDYCAIAEALGCSEFSARKRFWRAKKALQRQLSREGFGRGSLLMALLLFGKMTATSEAAAAKVSVTAATTRVGAAAALVAMAGTKTAVISLAAAGVIGVGTMVASSGPGGAADVGSQKGRPSGQVAEQSESASKRNGEYWYLFPEGKRGPMMARLMKGGSCQWMQDEQANYFFDKAENGLHVNNYRQWNRDLSVWRLPIDGAKLRAFLAEVDGNREEMGYVSGYGPGLLTVVARSEKGGSFWETRHENVLNEEYFRYSWPGGVEVIDNRDVMHRRGWTYFRITGQIDGDRVLGTGRMPFVYSASGRHRAWLRLRVGNRVQITDDGQLAVVRREGKVAGRYAGGSFFKGLGRPWMGLHTVDTVRRDAAEKRVAFETKYVEGEEKAEVILTCGQSNLVYTIDMKTDVIEKIVFGGGGDKKGELRFEYLQEIEEGSREFVRPSVQRYGVVSDGKGILWLMGLAGGEALNPKH